MRRRRGREEEVGREEGAGREEEGGSEAEAREGGGRGREGERRVGGAWCRERVGITVGAGAVRKQLGERQRGAREQRGRMRRR